MRPYFWRIYLLMGILVLGFIGLVWRVVYLGTVKRNFLEQQSIARTVRVMDIPAHRGMIVDRNGVPLAVSTPVEAVWFSPQLYEATAAQEIQLAKILDIPINVLRKKINSDDERTFIYLKRRLPPNQAAQVKALAIPGIFTQQEYQRYYPAGEVVAQVLGFTNIDDRGVEGLELAYEQWLHGVPGRKEVAKDRLGQVVNELRIIKEPQAGRDLVLSIDRNIQYLAYKELQDTVNKYHAEAGAAVVLDIKSGEILAMVNQPSYNPNARQNVGTNALRNRAVTDLFEPGSTMKTFSVASALESGKYKPETKIDTNPGAWYVDGHKITDEDINHGVLTVTGVLQKSSNIGVAKMTLALPPDNLLQLLRRFGFGELTYSGFPGEGEGRLPEHLQWGSFVLATLAFGYSISATPLQLARAYAAFGAGGILRPVTFLKTDKPPAGQKVISKKSADQMLQMLEKVLDIGGSGRRGQVAGYNVAGKTGTAYIAGAHGYDKDQGHYHAVFAGIAPVSNPRLVVVVMVKNPQGQHFGGLVAAPVFANVMEGALRILNVPPDNLPKAKLPKLEDRNRSAEH